MGCISSDDIRWHQFQFHLDHIIYYYFPFSLQMVYFASGANETAHVAKVVARQRSSKKTGRPHMVNTQMRVKPAAPLVLNGKTT